MIREAMVFDLRAEAEMRLHSDRVARELAVRKQCEEGGEQQAVAEAPAAAEGERAV
ncbi:hypothetical protein ABZT02_01660 [Streptomyces sp. NPDC005402]|uniref:hypothetical protein n=1 Tax=Streptomyces sp. NPDC005402 TaxID=3155338 RepID=UPI0033B1CFFC